MRVHRHKPELIRTVQPQPHQIDTAPSSSRVPARIIINKSAVCRQSGNYKFPFYIWDFAKCECCVCIVLLWRHTTDANYFYIVLVYFWFYRGRVPFIYKYFVSK